MLNLQSLALKSPSRYGPGPLWKKRQKDYLLEATRQKVQDETRHKVQDETQKFDLNSSFPSRNVSHDNTTYKNEDRDCKTYCIEMKKDAYPNIGLEIPISFWSQQALASRTNEHTNPLHLFSKNCSFTNSGT